MSNCISCGRELGTTADDLLIYCRLCSQQYANVTVKDFVSNHSNKEYEDLEHKFKVIELAFHLSCDDLRENQPGMEHWLQNLEKDYIEEAKKVIKL